jgi:hypothetical protein
MKKFLKWTFMLIGGGFAALMISFFLFADKDKDYSRFSQEGSEAQKFFINLTRQTDDSIDSDDNDAKKKLAWIQASRALCAAPEFNVNGTQSGWVGKVKSIEADDELNFTVELEIDNRWDETTTWSFLNKLKTDFSGEDNPSYYRMKDKLLDLSEGDYVSFSGAFVVGDLSGDNECLNQIAFDDVPEFAGATLEFELQDISKLD